MRSHKSSSGANRHNRSRILSPKMSISRLGPLVCVLPHLRPRLLAGSIVVADNHFLTLRRCRADNDGRRLRRDPGPFCSRARDAPRTTRRQCCDMKVRSRHQRRTRIETPDFRVREPRSRKADRVLPKASGAAPSARRLSSGNAGKSGGRGRGVRLARECQELAVSTATKSSPPSELDIFRRIASPDRPTLSDQRRYRRCSGSNSFPRITAHEPSGPRESPRSSDGTGGERTGRASFVTVQFLGILQSKARQSLKTDGRQADQES